MRHEESPHLDRHKDLRRDACKKCRQVLVKRARLASLPRRVDCTGLSRCLTKMRVDSTACRGPYVIISGLGGLVPEFTTHGESLFWLAQENNAILPNAVIGCGSQPKHPQTYREASSDKRLTVSRISVLEDFFIGFSGIEGQDRRLFMKHHKVFIPPELVDSHLVIYGSEKAVQAATEEVKVLLRYQALFNSTRFQLRDIREDYKANPSKEYVDDASAEPGYHTTETCTFQLGHTLGDYKANPSNEFVDDAPAEPGYHTTETCTIGFTGPTWRLQIELSWPKKGTRGSNM